MIIGLREKSIDMEFSVELGLFIFQTPYSLKFKYEALDRLPPFLGFAVFSTENHHLIIRKRGFYTIENQIKVSN